MRACSAGKCLGSHRVACGDSTNAEAVAALLGDLVPVLMVTDPPYGVDYDPTWRVRAGLNKNRSKLGKVASARKQRGSGP
jgi:hypothetical protein